ncbi:MAG: hypothetical protein FJW31_22145 [Acidobacteria bacterium]|nr:hypothetical protein [Acidobacteriota bacterium]
MPPRAERRAPRIHGLLTHLATKPHEICELATPYFATEYTFSHMGLAPRYQKQITSKMFEAGHMFYIVPALLGKLTGDIEDFVNAPAAASR